MLTIAGFFSLMYENDSTVAIPCLTIIINHELILNLF